LNIRTIFQTVSIGAGITLEVITLGMF